LAHEPNLSSSEEVCSCESNRERCDEVSRYLTVYDYNYYSPLLFQCHSPLFTRPFVVLFGLNFALLLAWSLVDPLRFVRLSADDNSVATAADVETYGACRSENKGLQAFGIPILVVNIGALILACIQAYRARGISDEYSETKYLAIAVGSWFEVVLVGIPLLVIVDR